jgi:hypothetical protein
MFAHIRKRATALGLAAVTAAAGFTIAPSAAQAASAATFYVDNDNAAACNDAGPGSQAEPFCTVQAAANAATAGDTVLIENDYLNDYQQPVTISHSGTAAAPITFEYAGLRHYQVVANLTVSGSYIDIDDGYFDGLSRPMTVTGSHVTFDRDEIGGNAKVAMQVGSNVSGLTVQHSFFTFSGNGGSMIDLGSGDSGTVLSADVFNGAYSPDSTVPQLSVSGDSGTEVTGDTFVGSCSAGISMAGSTGTSIENNVFGEGAGCVGAAPDVLSVDSASATGTTEGYNVLSTADGAVTPYSWAGKGYPTQAAFAAATGQGTEDTVTATFDTGTDSYSGDTAAEGTADPSAPGESATDVYGNAWSGTPDRGAIDLEEYTSAGLEAVNCSPQQVAVNLDLQGIAWGPSAAATINWGDGSGTDDLGMPSSVGNDFSSDGDYHMYAQRGTCTVTVTVTDAAQTVTKTIEVTAGGSTYVPVTPTRVLDTRDGQGAPAAPVAPQGTVAVNVLDGVKVPQNMGAVTAVVMNVTVAGSKSIGFISAYPAGTPVPSSSNVNFGTDEIVPNLVTVQVGANDEVDLHNSSTGATELLADVEGYYVDSSAGSYYLPNTPKRILDTRTTTGGHDYPVPADGDVTLSVPSCTQGSGASAVSAKSTAVAVNLTVADSKTIGVLTAYPTGGTVPTASNVNYAPGEIVPNMVVVEVNGNGQFSVHNGSKGTADVIVDLEGCYSASLGDAFVPVTPYRALDTRSGLGQESAKGIPAQPDANAVWWTQDDAIAPSNGPDNGVGAVVMNVTVAGSQTIGVITAYPNGNGYTRPGVSNLNFAAGEIVPNLVMVAVGPGFNLSLYNQSKGTTNLVVDYYGYFS